MKKEQWTDILIIALCVVGTVLTTATRSVWELAILGLLGIILGSAVEFHKRKSIQNNPTAFRKPGEPAKLVEEWYKTSAGRTNLRILALLYFPVIVSICIIYTPPLGPLASFILGSAAGFKIVWMNTKSTIRDIQEAANKSY